MTVGRSFRFGRSMRCGDMLIFTAIGVILLFILSMLLRSPSTTASTGRREKVDDKELWPRGKMREGGPVGRRHQHLSKINAAVEKLGLSPIIDSRPKECRSKYSGEGHGPDINQIAAAHPDVSIKLVIYPQDSTFSIPKLKATIVSVLATSAPLFPQIEIDLVASDPKSATSLRQSFESVANPKKPNFRVVERPNFFKSPTLFKELLSIANDFSDGHIVIFLSAGMQCTVGWLEGLLDPIIREDKDDSPIIVSPTFVHLNRETPSHNQLLFNWRMAPTWNELSKEKIAQLESAAEVIPSLMFLPQSFAIRRDRGHIGTFLSFCAQRGIPEPTTFDAAMYIWRCLGAQVAVAPCARVALTSSQPEMEFDPLIKFPRDAKKRIASNWLNEYRNKLMPTIGEWPLGDNKFGHCKSLSSMMSSNNEAELFSIMGQKTNKEGYFYLASEVGTTFLPNNGLLKAAVCPFPETTEMMFTQVVGGAIKTSSGLCLTAPAGYGYVELSECRDDDSQQKWVHRSDKKFESAASHLCIMHSSDPNSNEPADSKTQVLMITDCDENSNFVRFTKAENC